MSRSRLVLLVILSAAISAGLTAWVSRRWFPQIETTAHQEHLPEKRDFHQWLHDQLKFTPEQQAKLEPVEARFDQERASIQEKLAALSGELAHALGDSSKTSQDLQPLITERHRLQGELQKLLMAHLLEKRALLTPAQQEQYQEWIHQSIDHDHGD
jgi:Spy/CpxP family protein refolding chaperone